MAQTELLLSPGQNEDASHLDPPSDRALGHLIRNQLGIFFCHPDKLPAAGADSEEPVCCTEPPSLPAASYENDESPHPVPPPTSPAYMRAHTHTHTRTNQPPGKTHKHCECHLDWSLVALSGWNRGRVAECRKTVAFVLSIRANEQVQRGRCVCVCVRVSVSVRAPASSGVCVRWMLSEI